MLFAVPCYICTVQNLCNFDQPLSYFTQAVDIICNPFHKGNTVADIAELETFSFLSKKNFVTCLTLQSFELMTARDSDLFNLFFEQGFYDLGCFSKSTILFVAKYG